MPRADSIVAVPQQLGVHIHAMLNMIISWPGLSIVAVPQQLATQVHAVSNMIMLWPGLSIVAVPQQLCLVRLPASAAHP